MLTHQSIGHPSTTAQNTIQLITDAILAAKVQIKFTDYQHSMMVDGVTDGSGRKRIYTGRRTIVIELDSGDPDVSVEYTGTTCCGN